MKAFRLTVLVLIWVPFIALALAGCATERVYEDRYGDGWARCHVRGGIPAWCRVD